MLSVSSVVCVHHFEISTNIFKAYELEEEALPEEKIPTGIPAKDKAPPAKGTSVPIQISQEINPS